MKKIIIPLLMVLAGPLCRAQSAAVTPEEMIKANASAYKKDPTFENAYQLGMAYYHNKEYNKSIVYLTKATVKTANPNTASNAYLYRGIIRIAQKNFNDGYTDLRKALALNPKNSEVYRHRGLAEINSGENIKAIQDFSTYAMYVDKSWESYNTLANDILKSGTTDRELLEKAKDLALLSESKQKNISNAQTLSHVVTNLKDATATPSKLPVKENPAVQSSTEVSKSVPAVKPESKIVVAENVKKETKKDAPESTARKQAEKADNVAVNEIPPVADAAPKGLEIPDLGKIRKAKVWAVVIGVSKYTTSNLNLKYANTDADMFYKFLRSPSGGSIPAEQIVLITNEKATRTEILKAMRTTFGKAFDSDVIILYIASHGQTENGEFYFLTTEAEPGYLNATALSRSSIAEAFNNKTVRAKKKLIFADACHSGELMKVDLGGARGDDESSALEQSNQLLVEMAQTNEGCAIMTASTGAQKSYEDGKWGGGHGIFTYSLIEGLKGKADYDGNKIITLNEINEYVFRSVTEATDRKQQPSFQGSFDDHFPMSVVIK